MVRRSTSCRCSTPSKLISAKIERTDKHIDHPNGITLVNEIIEAFGQQRPLPTIRLFNKAPHRLPHRITRES